MKRMLIFHPALAPYRVDFFNTLTQYFDVELVLHDVNLLNQKFDQASLVGQMKCRISYLLHGFVWKGRRFRFGVLRKLRMAKPDIVLGCEYSLSIIVLLLYRFLSRGKYKLYTLSDDNLTMFERRDGIKAVLRWLFIRWMDGIILTNETVVEAYRKITPAHSKIKYFVIPILHDEASIRRNEESVIAAGKVFRRNNFANFKKVVLFVGRFAEVKNIKWLVRQFATVSNLSDVALVLVGGGGQESELREIALSQHAKNIILQGRKEGDEVYEMMAMADCLVLPSKFEPYGAVVGEALQWGTPCLVSDCVGSKSLIGPQNGAVFNLDDTQDFLKKLHTVLRLKASCHPKIDNLLPRAVAKWAK